MKSKTKDLLFVILLFVIWFVVQFGAVVGVAHYLDSTGIK